MTSDKKSAALIADIFVKEGLEHIVISPGSRNAPIIIAFAGNQKIRSLSVFDERSAAFFALGIAQQTRKTVAIACTSGTAALNYAPAIAEAYYQKAPLLVLTADRPPEWIDQGDGQTIRQKEVYGNYIRASYEIAEDLSGEKEFDTTVGVISEAIRRTIYPAPGPVHINLPFSEPLYNQVPGHAWNLQLPDHIPAKSVPPDEKTERFIDVWNVSSKKLLIAGMMHPDDELSALLREICDDPSVALLSETTSNLSDCPDLPCIDKIIHTIGPEEAARFRPDLLVTFGGPVISKMVKAFLRKNKPSQHWHIDPVDYEMDTYLCLTGGIAMDPAEFFRITAPLIRKTDSGFGKLWQERMARSESRHNTFLSRCEFSDLKVFEEILKNVPERSFLQLGNSTPVRYAQLFPPLRKRFHYSNRGTSGIDGAVSTAAGAAWATGDLTTLITGDLGFLYDSNALLNDHLSEKLRIIVINNSGGGIFRFIPGPDTTPHLERFFETRHKWRAEYIAQAAGIEYMYACNLKETTEGLKALFRDPLNRPAILEIKTPAVKNARILKSYFKYLTE